ncbi:glycosyltransferase family 4 protein [Halomicrobium urmianum]|uniref:glycosyltransferase family 4 protein n=1 Tax=Halomicrobium urmianum TaxID=1586233 RepID=UPI001CDA4542|nr:glycosyltransferase family 4 protein [Halomicrobium urmianum]
MRLAFIHPQYPSGEGTGAAYSATQIVQGLASMGYDIDVYCQEKPQESYSQEGVKLEYLSGYSSHPHTETQLNRELIARIDDFREYDIVHSYPMSFIPSIGRIGEKLGVNTVVTLNAYGGICPKNDLLYMGENECKKRSNPKCLHCISRTGTSNSKHRYLYKTISQLFSLNIINNGQDYIDKIGKYHALTSHVKEKYTDFGFPQERVQVIPNILDERFCIDHESDFSEPYKFIYVGNLDRHKGVHQFPGIISRLQEWGEYDFELTIIGSGDYKGTLKKNLNKQNLSSYVTFEGDVLNECLPEIYANHDLFIYPGIWDEPFGRVFLEALGTGTPIVTTDVGATKEIVGGAGIIVEPDSNEIASAVHSAVSKNILPKLSKNTGDQVQVYSSDSILRQFDELYHNLL